MSQLSLLPNYVMRQFNNDGRLLSGGKIYFYQAGTNTPKVVFKDSTGTIPHTNPVILDASGSEIIFLGQGAYKIKITDLNDVQIDTPVDGVFGNGSGGVSSESTATATLLLNYNELRSLITTPDVVYVAGRTTEGDGGQGWFQYIPTSTEIDDDSIILTAQSGSKVYRRIFDGVIDPRWAGLTYNVSIDQATYFNKNSLLSVKYGLPVLYTASTYINQNVSAIENSTIQMADTGYFISTIGINMVFNSGSVFLGSDRAFGQSVQPKFSNNVVSEIRLSWMAGNTDDERMDKLLLSSTDPNAVVVIDESVSILASIWVFPNITKHTNSSIITFTGGSVLSITAKYLEANPVKIYSTTASSYSFDFGSNYAFSEWFGAVGDGIVDDSSAFKYAAKSGKVELVKNKSYKIDSAVIPSTLEIKGSATITIGSGTSFSNTTLTMTEVYIVKTGGDIWYTGTNLFLYNCSIPSNYTVSGVKVVDGCSYTGESRYPIFDGTVGPSIYNAHLPQITNAFSLYTDLNGKIGKGTRRIGYDWTVKNFAGNTQYYNNLRHLNGYWIIVGSNGLIKTSTDMVNWTVRNSGTTVYLSDVTWNGTYYVVVGDSSTYLRSTDLITWTPATSRPTTNGVPVFVCTNGSRFVTCDGYNGQVVSSPDGLNWSNVKSLPGGSGAGSLAFYKNGVFICGGNRGYVSISTDGVTFGGISVPNGPQFYCAEYDGNNIVLISAGTSILFSNISSGSYTSYPTGQTETIYNMKFIDGTFVAVGANGRIMTSPNGKQWTNRHSGTSSSLYGLECNGFDIYTTGAGEIIMKEDYR